MIDSPNGTEELMDDLSDEILNTELTDDAYEELAVSEGAVVVGLAFWESSLGDEMDEEPPAPEAWSSSTWTSTWTTTRCWSCTTPACSRPTAKSRCRGLDALEAALVDLADSESELIEVAQTEDDALALVFGVEEQPKLIIAVGAWSVSEWDELPED